MFNLKKQKGFTLVEILVVVTIIGIIAAISSFALLETRSQARDVVRINTLHEIAAALELYAVEYGNFPLCDGGLIISPGFPFYRNLNADPAAMGCPDHDRIVAFFERYFNEAPVDPNGPYGVDNDRYYVVYDYHWCGFSDGQRIQHIIWTTLETDNFMNREEVCPAILPNGNPGGGYLIWRNLSNSQTVADPDIYVLNLERPR